MPSAWKIYSFADVKQLWSGVRTVPGRTQGREHSHEERYCFGLYLHALGTHQVLRYPLQVEQGESPDFMVTWPVGEVTGLEVTRMTTQWLQEAMTHDERKYLRRTVAAATCGQQAEPVCRSLDDGLVAGEPEAKWCELFREAVQRKLDKMPNFRPASRYDLLISDDSPIGGVDRSRVIAPLRSWLRGLDTLKLGTVSVIISLDVLFDLRGRARVLPHVEF